MDPWSASHLGSEGEDDGASMTVPTIIAVAGASVSNGNEIVTGVFVGDTFGEEE